MNQITIEKVYERVVAEPGLAAESLNRSERRALPVLEHSGRIVYRSGGWHPAVFGEEVVVDDDDDDEAPVVARLASPSLERVSEELGQLLNAALDHFKPGTKATLVIIPPPELGDAGLVIGNAGLDQAIAEIQRRQRDIAAVTNPKRSKPRRMARSST